jgi:hypothetical protein
MIQFLLIYPKNIKVKSPAFMLLLLALIFGGCSKKENPYFITNNQTNTILNCAEAQFDSLHIHSNFQSSWYNQNTEDLIENDELDSLYLFTKNLGLPSVFIPENWGFNEQEFFAKTHLKANQVFEEYDTINPNSISSKIKRLSTSEVFQKQIAIPLKEYHYRQSLILEKSIEIQIFTQDSLLNFIKNINHQRKNKWISKSSYDAFLTNAHETFSEIFRLKCTEAKLDIQSTMSLKLLLDQLSADLSEKHWELVVSQLQKK